MHYRINVQNNLNGMKSEPEPIDFKEVNRKCCASGESENCIISGLRGALFVLKILFIYF